MRTHIQLIGLALAVAVSAAGAAEQTFEQRAEAFARDRYRDARLLIEGPRVVRPPVVDANAGCIALYQRRVALQRGLDDRNPAYFDDPRNQSAVFLGTIWTPAFYFLGYSAVTARLDELTTGDPSAEIDALRQASAALRCFEK